MTLNRDDIERKAEELIGAVDQTKQAVKNQALIGALIVAAVIAIAFIFGRRRGGRNKTVVEVYRV